LLEDIDVQCLLGDDLLQASVLLAQLLKTLCLAGAHLAVLVSPAMKDCFAYADLWLPPRPQLQRSASRPLGATDELFALGSVP
jgi:hypothetical protein